VRRENTRICETTPVTKLPKTMEKYKSDLINEEDIRIYTDKRETKNGTLQIVTIKHLLSEIVASYEDKSQLIAYNEAIKLLEDTVQNIITEAY